MTKVIPTGEACRNIGFVMNMILVLSLIASGLVQRAGSESALTDGEMRS